MLDQAQIVETIARKTWLRSELCGCQACGSTVDLGVAHLPVQCAGGGGFANRLLCQACFTERASVQHWHPLHADWKPTEEPRWMRLPRALDVLYRMTGTREAHTNTTQREAPPCSREPA